jgi:hypothetical protein
MIKRTLEEIKKIANNNSPRSAKKANSINMQSNFYEITVEPFIGKKSKRIKKKVPSLSTILF